VSTLQPRLEGSMSPDTMRPDFGEHNGPAVTELVRRIDRGELEPNPSDVAHLAA
jgi:hypothetical protein